jgi:hypothetical protein
MSERIPRAAPISIPGARLMLTLGVIGAWLGGTPLAGAAMTSRFDGPLPDIQRGPVQVRLRLVTSDVTAPLAGITAPGRASMLYLVDQIGQLKELDLTLPRPVRVLRTVLDVSALLVGPVDPKDERGFLGAAFSPDFSSDGLLYTYTSEAFLPGVVADFPLPADPNGPCNLRGVVADHRSVIREWQRVSSNPLRFEPASASRILFTVDQPQTNHNAGDMKFGPDRMLYIGFGDGGGADDQNCQTNFDGQPMFGHGGAGNGQNPTNPLGDILRIDPRGNNSANQRYGIPANNPFATRQPNGQLREIYATGFRNPFRFSFDAADFIPANASLPGRLWVGDVGQNDVEEVNVVEAGRNYGWRVKEGTFLFNPDGFELHGSRSDAFVFFNAPGFGNYADPVAQYDHDDGTAIIGGYVYRGSDIPALAGQYVFGDTSRRLNNAHGRLFATSGAKSGPHRIVELRDGPLDVQLIGFGQDSRRELYALVYEPGESGHVLLISR